jgi:hypothetical protein
MLFFYVSPCLQIGVFPSGIRISFYVCCHNITVRATWHTHLISLGFIALIQYVKSIDFEDLQDEFSPALCRFLF